MIIESRARCSCDAEIDTKFSQGRKVEEQGNLVNFGLKSIKRFGWSAEGFFDWPHDIGYSTDKPAVIRGMTVLLVEYVLFSFSTCSSSSPRSHSPNPHRDSRGLPANRVGSRYCTLCYCNGGILCLPPVWWAGAEKWSTGIQRKLCRRKMKIIQGLLHFYA